jgi:putative transcriptional regulator
MTDALESRAGRLLIASPSLADPNFHRAVILMLEHGPEGALGVILNHPTELSAREVLPDHLARGMDDDAVVFKGGPVEPEAVIMLADFTDPDRAAKMAVDSVGIVDPEAEELGVENGIRAVRAFSGYAGWSAGQLEREIDEDAWIDAVALASDVFDVVPAQLWRTVLERKGGPYVLVSRMPDDPSLN